MAGQPALEVTGVKEFNRAMKRMARDVDNLKAIHAEAARRVADRARERVPIGRDRKQKGKRHRGGTLQRSIKPGASKTQAYVKAGSKLVPYAAPIHFGWPRRNISPQPFLYDALDDRRNEVVGLYQKRIGDLVERVGRETP